MSLINSILPPHPVVAPKATPKTTTSVDPLYKLATAQAQQALAAEQAPVQAEQQASDAYYQQRAADQTGVATALSNLLKGIGPAIGNQYETEIGRASCRERV